MDSNSLGYDISGWASIAAIVATVGTIAGAYIRLYVGQERSVATQTRSEATDINLRSLQESRDVSRDILAALHTILATDNAIKEMMARIVISHERLVKMQEDANFVERTAHQIETLFEKEREKDRDRERERRKE